SRLSCNHGRTRNRCPSVRRGAVPRGAGGAVAVDAGTFNMSNAMTSVGQSAAGVMVANQNSGFASLVQQSINVQANLNVGK
ncbi:hypothetical protein ACQCQS_18575, partial [Ralstonia pseudosolanacearum]